MVAAAAHVIIKHNGLMLEHILIKTEAAHPAFHVRYETKCKILITIILHEYFFFVQT